MSMALTTLDTIDPHDLDFFARDYAAGKYEDTTLDTILAHIEKFGPEGACESALHLDVEDYAIVEAAVKRNTKAKTRSLTGRSKLT